MSQYDDDGDRYWEEEFSHRYRRKERVTCKICHEGDLTWALIKGKYQLVDEDGEKHLCDQLSIARREFSPIKD